MELCHQPIHELLGFLNLIHHFPTSPRSDRQALATMSTSLRIPSRLLAGSRGFFRVRVSHFPIASSIVRRSFHHARSLSTFERPKLFEPSTTSRNLVTPIKTHPGRLADKVAVVTGSSAGIGRAIALAFPREGTKVFCSDLKPLAAVDIKDEAHVATHDAITDEGDYSAFVKADVGEAHEVEELVHEAVDIFGRVDMNVFIYFQDSWLTREVSSIMLALRLKLTNLLHLARVSRRLQFQSTTRL